MVQLLWKTVWQFLKKLKTELLYDPAILLLGIYPPRIESRDSNRYLHTQLTAALFTISKRWKQHTYPMIDEQINKMWSIHTMEYDSAFKRSETLIQATIRMDLEDIMQSEINQSKKRQIVFDSTLIRGA